VPGARNLPRMWTSGIRSYHPATFQEMVRQAIQMRLDLRVKGADGTIRQLTPRRLEHRGERGRSKGKTVDSGCGSI